MTNALKLAMRSGLYKASRHVGVDGRRREAKRYRNYFKHYITLTNGRHQPLVEQLCSMLVQRENLQRRQLCGEPNLEIKLTRTASQVTQIMRTLNLVAKDDDGEARRDMAEAGLL